MIETIIKRNGKTVNFDKNRIVRAINLAMMETQKGLDKVLSVAIADYISGLNCKSKTVEEIQDIIEEQLMKSHRIDVAKQYILYREKREVWRNRNLSKGGNKLLSNEFISKYKHTIAPMNPLGMFIFYRTYSRWIPELNRREYWWETVLRAVEYNCSLAPTTKEEAELLYDNIFNLRQFLSGRTFWIGGTEASIHYPMANFNCAGIVIDNLNDYKDLFYALMVGTGVGIRILKSDVNKVAPIRKGVAIIHEDYNPIPKELREDNTTLEFFGEIAKITIGDSKEGWTQSLDFYLKLISSKEYRNIKTIIFNYDNVRPEGERLKKFGGYASGHNSVKKMFSKIHEIICTRANTTPNQQMYFKLKPIDCMDIANIIGQNVVVGGTRRTAEIILFDSDDEEVIKCKNNLYTEVNGEWIENDEISHRKMSNNSIMYYKKPTREFLHWHIQQMRYSGEPAFYIAENALKRRSDFALPNPCGEILLMSKELCNLTTVNVLGFVEKDGSLDYERLYYAQRLSARAGYRMTCVTLELNEWDINQKEDRLIGCSLTGWQDMINATNLSEEKEIELLRKLREIVHEESKKLALEVGGKVPLLATTIKPEGTLSLLPTVSSGLHFSHSPYYIRRIRINNNDPLLAVMKELEYPIHPDNGKDGEHTSVIEFPVKAPNGKTKYDVSAIEQLEIYKKFMINYVDHNASITVHVREHEWDEVEQWIWDNWEYVIGISFLSLDDSYYPLLPYEACAEEEYIKRKAEMKPFTPSLLQKYEKQEVELDVRSDEDCASGACGVR